MGRWNEWLFVASGSHDQDGRQPIYGKNPLKTFFPGSGGPISMKLDMSHW